MVADTVSRVLRSLPATDLAPTSTIRPPGLDDTVAAPSLSGLTPIAVSEDAAEFELRELLGEGGMGRVVLARQRSLGRDVAVKSLLPNRRSPEGKAALLAEARCTGALEHPNIVPIHVLGVDQDGGPVLVMKRVEGTSWRTLLRRRASPGDTLERDLGILMQVCNAVHFAHTRGIIHRDIKPDNVMVGEFGEVYLVDWGLALRLAERERATELAGTPAYMAPEMLTGGLALSPRTDVYLLGASLYEVLSGRPPHHGNDLTGVLSSVETGPAALDAAAPDELALVCARAMAALPQERFVTPTELRDAVAAFQRHRGAARLADEALARLRDARTGAGAQKRKLLVECQFGFRQALREWPDGEAARRGLDDCLAELARLEIAERNLGAAELVAEELGRPAALVQEIDGLRRTLADEEAGRARLEQIDRDQDLGVSRRARVVLATSVILFHATTVVYSVLQLLHGVVMTREELTRLVPFQALVAAAVVFLARKPLFKNRANRTFAYLLMVISAAYIGHRLLTNWLPRPPEQTLVNETYLLGMLFAVVGVMQYRWMLAVAALILTGAVIGARWPEPAVTGIITAVTLPMPFVGMVIVWSRRAPRKP